MSERQSNTGSLQRMLEDAIRAHTRKEILLGGVIERKLREQGVRVTRAERKTLIAACATYLQTGESGEIDKAISRKRRVEITLQTQDLAKFARKFTGVMSKAVESSISQVARKWEPELRRQFDAIGHHTSSELRRADRRRERQWQMAFSHYRRFLALAIHAGEASRHFLLADANHRRNVLIHVLIRLHARACLVGAEIESLMRSGFADAAMARWRTLHEITVVSYFLTSHGETAAQRYVAHDAVERAKAARFYNEHSRALGHRAIDRRIIKRVMDEVEALKAQFGKSFAKEYGWAAEFLGRDHVTFEMLELASKLPHLRPYYKFASQQVHASPQAMMFRLGMYGGEGAQYGELLLVGPTNYGFADPGQNAVLSLTQITTNLLTIEPNADALALAQIMIRWRSKASETFVRTQLRIEKREALFRRSG